MKEAHQVLIRNLNEQSRLEQEDLAEIGTFQCAVRDFEPNEDFIRQGEEPEFAALVVSGMVARYHLLSSGRRQYLSFHLPGDLPDAQGLFIERMDHALCAMGPASVGFIPHRELLRAFKRRPNLGIAIWRRRCSMPRSSGRPSPTTAQGRCRSEWRICSANSSIAPVARG